MPRSVEEQQKKSKEQRRELSAVGMRTNARGAYHMTKLACEPASPLRVMKGAA
jgi:hypothetical protein